VGFTDHPIDLYVSKHQLRAATDVCGLLSIPVLIVCWFNLDQMFGWVNWSSRVWLSLICVMEMLNLWVNDDL